MREFAYSHICINRSVGARTFGEGSRVPHQDQRFGEVGQHPAVIWCGGVVWCGVVRCGGVVPVVWCCGGSAVMAVWWQCGGGVVL